MTENLAREVTGVNPKFGRRSWVKLWVNEWLDGTTRFEMADIQRAFWIDLLALAGRSRFPGRICAGQTDGNFVGYPLNKFQSLMAEPIDVEQTLNLFERTGKIKLTVTADTPTKLVMLELLNWDKYQSEYQRQKPYRKRGLQEGDQQSYTQSNKTEVEVDTDVEVEGEKPFDVFWNLYPRKVGKKPAKACWHKLKIEEKALAVERLKLWMQADQWHREDGKFIPHASTYLQQRRWEDEPWKNAFICP
jgi:hypothetical protein